MATATLPTPTTTRRVSKAEEKRIAKELQLQEDLKKQVKVRVLETLHNHIDYGEDRFKNLPINRDMKRSNEITLLNAFKEVHPNGVSVLQVIRTGAWDKGIKTDYMCDGHHRRKVALEFAKLINMPVPLYFNIIEIDGEDTIENVGIVLQTININLGTWALKDFTSHNAKLGTEIASDYKKLQDLSGKYNLPESDLVPILSLNQISMGQFKKKKFFIPNIKKSMAILNVISKIGFNVPQKDKFDAFPQSNAKRVIYAKLISLDTNQIRNSIPKFQRFLKDNQFSYDDGTLRMQLESIFKR